MVIVMGAERKEGVFERGCWGFGGGGNSGEEEGKPSVAGGRRELVGAKDELCWYKSARF